MSAPDSYSHSLMIGQYLQYNASNIMGLIITRLGTVPGEYRFRLAFFSDSGLWITIDSHKIEY